MPRHGSPYGYRYQRERDVLLSYRLPCQLRLVCEGDVADSADHDPPVALHHHVVGSGCCRLLPACERCQKVQGGEVARQLRLGRQVRTVPEPSRRW